MVLSERDALMSNKNLWTRQQLLVAFSLYCRLPFGKLHSRNPEIIKYSRFIGRTPSALAMKLSNIASIDPVITSSGRKGLIGASENDRNMWHEMQSDWDNFVINSEKAVIEVSSKSQPDNEIEHQVEFEDYTGNTTPTQINARLGQNFFRKSVLSAYNEKCCITGLSVPSLLVASHIVPWSIDQSNRLNPRNGLALSMLHDKAFDLGIITINEDMTVRVSQKDVINNKFFSSAIQSYNGKPIFLPEKFKPIEEFLLYHRQNIFEH